MSVTLPDYGYTGHAITPIDFGGALVPILGGPEQRLNRLGDRLAVTITTPALKNSTDGRVLFQRLMRARKAGALMVLPQSGVAVGSPGSPVVAFGVSGGTTVPISGLTSGYTIREGQPFSVIHAGRRYLHFANTDTTASGGSASVVVTPMLRTPLTAGDTIELALPMIEGALEGDPVSWERSAASFAPFTYTVRETQ